MVEPVVFFYGACVLLASVLALLSHRPALIETAAIPANSTDP